MPQVRQLQRERQLARRDAPRVRPKRVQHALHGVAVLVEVLGRGGEGDRGGVVGIRVLAASDRAGQHARRDRAVVDPHERLGARAEQAVDRVGPGVGVAEREVHEHAAQVGALGQVTDEVAREHHLAERAGADAAHGIRDHRAVAGRDRGCPACSESRYSGPSGVVATGSLEPLMRVTQLTPSRRPTITSGTMSTLGCSDSSSKVKAPKPSRPLPERSHLVVDPRGARDPAPGLRGLVHPVRPVELQPERLAEADDALAAAKEQQRTLRVEQREQRRVVVDGPCLDREGGYGVGRHRRRRVRHGSSL